ncbi:uncharacterized protein At5g08430-like isoform X3 [Rhododendron vialii]|uniref:uncharacterized protein At5g08430-like isoform X3 n=1 Tax=Rhododendron vialii TaxID=182163 RepID=UPI00265ED956|nr:uncharacterized protein At5g08430-like isoform X3 [Rhododendron vialii]
MKKKTGKRTVNKEEICEDWCFVCKDGGLLFTCDYKQCLKAYHARCVGKDELFFDSGNRWSCEWHSCLICHNRSKFHCFCCPNAVCKRCMINTKFSCVRGEKGFCNHCLKLALLSEENVDVDSDGEQVDFKDRDTYEGLFMEYWEIIKKQEGLTLEDLRFAYAQLKKGENIKSDYVVESEEDEDIQLRSDYEDEDDVEERKPMKKIKKSKGQQLVMKRKVVSNKREFIGWGSKSLIDFLASIGKDTSTELSQVQVSSIITAYINENRLFDSERKRKILCDDRLKSVLGRKTVNRNKIHDLLEPHFVNNLEPSEDEFEYSSEDKDENVLVACKKQKKLSTCRKIQEKEEVYNAPQSCFASITSENIKLVYLRRSLVQELLKQLGNFEGKLLGSFVRVRSEFIDFTQRSSFQLLQVTGMRKVTMGETKTEILLQVPNMSIDVGVDMLSDDNFSEEECDDLRQKVKDGLLRKLTIVELEHKAKSLHEDITNHWINRQLALLQNLIDRANEKGWRRELFEYMERRKLLQTPEEKSRLLETVPRVIADVAEVESMSNDAIKESKQEDGSSPKSILMESLESPGDDRGGSGIPSGDRAVTNSNYDFWNFGFSSATCGNGNAQGTQQENIGSNIKVAEGNEQTCCASISEAKQSPATETCIIEEQPCLITSEETCCASIPEATQSPATETCIIEQTCLITSEERVKHSKVYVIVDQPSVAEKRNQLKDLEQKSMRIEEAPAVQLIDLSSNDDDNDDTDITIRKEKFEDQDASLWLCLGPNEERMGPLSLPLLKRWSEISSFALKFKVWKTGEREENAIWMSEAVRLSSLEN